MDELDARRLTLLATLDDCDINGADWTKTQAERVRQLLARHRPSARPGDAAARARELLGQWLATLGDHGGAAQRWFNRAPSLSAIAGLALAAALVAGALIDRLAGVGFIRVLEPQILGLVLWNLALYLALLVGALRGAQRHAPGPLLRAGAAIGRWLAQRRRPAELTALAPAAFWDRFEARWQPLRTPLAIQHTTLALHLAQAGLALGLIGGLYWRGLLQDYGIGWSSTFIDPASMQRAVALIFAPAAALLGITLPDSAAMAALRVLPGATPVAGGAAAPYIHLHAMTLVLTVIAPRLALAAAAALGARRSARAIARAAAQLATRAPAAAPLAWREVALITHGMAPDAGFATSLRAALGGEHGAQAALHEVARVALGDEDTAALAAPPVADKAVADTSVLGAVVLGADLGATPEVEQIGRLIARLRAQRGSAPALLVLDSAAFDARFANYPERGSERRAAWRGFAAEQALPLAIINSRTTDPTANRKALREALAPLRSPP